MQNAANRVDTSREELIANGSWKPVARTGRTNAGVKVREMYDSVSGESWFVAVNEEKRPDPLEGFTMLTTPEEKFGRR